MYAKASGIGLIEFRVPCFSNEQGFWIGKASLRQWRQLALEQLEEEEEETKHSDCKTNGENSTGAKGNVDIRSSSIARWYLAPGK